MHESLKKDKEVVLAAVKQNGPALTYADESLKKDKEVVWAAVKHFGYALQYASEELRVNEEFIAECLKERWYQHKNKNTMYDVWDQVPREIQEKYDNQWEILMASYIIK